MGAQCSCESQYAGAASNKQISENCDQPDGGALREGLDDDQIAIDITGVSSDPIVQHKLEPDAYQSEGTTLTDIGSQTGRLEENFWQHHKDEGPATSELRSPKMPLLFSTSSSSSVLGLHSEHDGCSEPELPVSRRSRSCARLKITIHRDSVEDFLGLDVAHVLDRFLQVTEIVPGGAAAETDLRVGDVIRYVNGVGTSCDHMVQESIFREDLTFEVLRPLKENFDVTQFLSQNHPVVPRLNLAKPAPHKKSGRSEGARK